MDLNVHRFQQTPGGQEEPYGFNEWHNVNAINQEANFLQCSAEQTLCDSHPISLEG